MTRQNQGIFVQGNRAYQTTICYLFSMHLVISTRKTINREIAKASDFVKYVKQALENQCISANPSLVLDDFISNTCFIIKDSTEWKYIHKSIAEYHTALYVAEMPTATAETFYTVVYDKDLWRAWYQEIYFLMIIDKYNSYRCLIKKLVVDFLMKVRPCPNIVLFL